MVGWVLAIDEPCINIPFLNPFKKCRLTKEKIRRNSDKFAELTVKSDFISKSI